MHHFWKSLAVNTRNLLLLSLLLGVTKLCSADITYYVDQTAGAGTVTGSIVTDGTVGVLSKSDIVSENLWLTDPLTNVRLTTWDLTTVNFFPFAGSDLSATAQQLLFNFSGTDGGVVDFADPSLDFDFCLSTPGGVFGPASFCEVGGETLSFLIAPIDSTFPTGFDFQSTPLSGTQVIGTAGATLPNVQGGTTSSPVLLLSGQPVGEVSGSIGGFGSQDYYSFYWAGGAFSATASITGVPNSEASYLFSEGIAGSCNSGGTATLNSGDSFTSNIGIANLLAGEYCIGIDANNPNDPHYMLTFNTPVSGSAVPEPSYFVLFTTGLAMATALCTIKRRWLVKAVGQKNGPDPR